MASEEMQGWHETNGKKLKVFSIILGEDGIWNNLDTASKKKTTNQTSKFYSKCLEKYCLQQNTFNSYYCELSVEAILAPKSDTGTCDKRTSIKLRTQNTKQRIWNYVKCYAGAQVFIRFFCVHVSLT